MTEQKKPRKKRSILRIILLFIGAVVLFLACFIGYFIAVMPKDQGPLVTWDKKLIGVHEASYTWIIRTPQGVILVDSGMDQEAKAIKAQLAKHKLSAKDVKFILLTHGHIDHISGVKAFPQAKVWIGPGEGQLVAGKTSAGGLTQRTMARFGKPLSFPQPFQELKDGQTLKVGGESFRVIHTPGHTQGSVMYLWGKLLFAGDTIMGSPTSVQLLPSLLMEDLGVTMQSLRKLKKFPFDTMADGHVGITPKARQKLTDFLQQQK